MKPPFALIALISVCLFGAASAVEAPKPQTEQQALRLVKEIQAQQTTINENQTKIEAKLATIAEAVRQARIFASRSK